MPRRSTIVVLTLSILSSLALPALPAAAAVETATLTGVVFEDVNRDGVHSAGEATWAGAPMDLFDSRGWQVATTGADMNGLYSFTGLPPGSYTVAYNERSWWDLRADWVPTTTGNLRPRKLVEVAGSTRVDLGLRRIVRATIGSPLSRVVGADGLVVESYNDAVTASEVLAAIMAGTLRGAETGTTLVRFAVGTSNVTTISYGGGPGTYSGFTANVQTGYLSWLDRADASLMHEYGHAWSLYHALIVQQDRGLESYLRSRGVFGDPRVNSSAAWMPEEMIAEDYRQLFGSPTARQGAQENLDLPPAAAVFGLELFLRTTFMTPPPPNPAPAPIPEPAPGPAITSVAMSPTPVTKSGTASFSLAASATVTMEIVDASGALVRSLLRDVAAAGGPTTATWNRRDDSGARVRSGNYSLRVSATAGGVVATGSFSFQVR